MASGGSGGPSSSGKARRISTDVLSAESARELSLDEFVGPAQVRYVYHMMAVSMSSSAL